MLLHLSLFYHLELVCNNSKIYDCVGNNIYKIYVFRKLCRQVILKIEIELKSFAKAQTRVTFTKALSTGFITYIREYEIDGSQQKFKRRI